MPDQEVVAEVDSVVKRQPHETSFTRHVRMDQIAFYCTTDTFAHQIKIDLGLDECEWIRDRVTAKSEISWVPGHKTAAINVADLQFNYDYGIELEIITYVAGPHWHQNNPLCSQNGFNRGLINGKFISHIGIHLADGEDFPAMPYSRLVQETWTIGHTSDYLTTGAGSGRKYHYRIYELTPGTYIKYIQRINP